MGTNALLRVYLALDMHILFLSRWFPSPPDNGSKFRVLNLLRGLAAAHEVSLISFTEGSIDHLDIQAIDRICTEVAVVPWKQFNPNGLRASMGFMSPKPRSVINSYSPNMSEKIQSAVKTNKFDMVIASQIDTAGYYKDIKFLPAVFEEVEIGLLHDQTDKTKPILIRMRADLTWRKHRRYLANVLKNFRACTVVSEQEKKLLSNAIPEFRHIKVFPNCIHSDDYQAINEKPEPNTLIFTGSFRYRPNYQAMEWFVREVLPRLQQKIQGLRLIITGDPAGLTLPETGNIEILGYVKDIRPLLARSWVSLAPLQSGGGTRIKILEAMALGTPVVATTKGAQGLDTKSGENILIADTPEGFCDAVYRLLIDINLRYRLAENAMRLVREKYDWKTIMPEYLTFIEDIARS